MGGERGDGGVRACVHVEGGTGEMLEWRGRWLSPWRECCPWPLLQEGCVFCSRAFSLGGACVCPEDFLLECLMFRGARKLGGLAHAACLVGLFAT